MTKPTTLITFGEDALKPIRYKQIGKCHACGRFLPKEKLRHTPDSLGKVELFAWVNRTYTEVCHCGSQLTSELSSWWGEVNGGAHRNAPLVIREKVHGPLEDLFCQRIKEVNDRISFALIDATVSTVLEFLLTPKNIGYLSKTLLSGADFCGDPAFLNEYDKTHVTYKMSRAVAKRIAENHVPIFTEEIGPFSTAAIAYVHSSLWLLNKFKEDTRFVN